MSNFEVGFPINIQHSLFLVPCSIFRLASLINHQHTHFPAGLFNLQGGLCNDKKISFLYSS